MFAKLTIVSLTATLLATSALAETFEVQMLNRGDEGAMVFEPAFVAAAVGDTINFVSVDKGHNVEAIEDMLPQGAEPFKSDMSADFALTLTTEGLYGIKCTPHFGMGMVGLIQVGAPVNYDDAIAVPQRGKSKERFEAMFAQVVR